MIKVACHFGATVVVVIVAVLAVFVVVVIIVALSTAAMTLAFKLNNAKIFVQKNCFFFLLLLLRLMLVAAAGVCVVVVGVTGVCRACALLPQTHTHRHTHTHTHWRVALLSRAVSLSLFRAALMLGCCCYSRCRRRLLK